MLKDKVVIFKSLEYVCYQLLSYLFSICIYDKNSCLFVDKCIIYAGEDATHPACQRFYNDALTVSFTKILTDDAVSSWKNNIQQCVRSNCEKLVKLCAMKLDDPRFLHLLSMTFNPNNK